MTGVVLSQGIPPDGLLLLNRLSRERHLPSPLLCQMFPARVARLDQYNLLLSSPALELFFPSDRIENLIKCFVVHQSLAMVLPRKAIDLPVLCSHIRRSMLFVMPIYRVPVRLATMYVQYE